jgi:hypothetical protein
MYGKLGVNHEEAVIIDSQSLLISMLRDHSCQLPRYV